MIVPATTISQSEHGATVLHISQRRSTTNSFAILILRLVAEITIIGIPKEKPKNMKIHIKAVVLPFYGAICVASKVKEMPRIKVEGNNAPAKPPFENGEPAAVLLEQLIAAVKPHIQSFNVARAPESNR